MLVKKMIDFKISLLSDEIKLVFFSFFLQMKINCMNNFWAVFQDWPRSIVWDVQFIKIWLDHFLVN